jgi:type I restriction enzyme S subunit
MFRLLRTDFVKYANQQVSGFQHPRVDFQKISNFYIPLPSLPEQHQIVEEIERRFSITDEVE